MSIYSDALGYRKSGRRWRSPLSRRGDPRAGQAWLPARKRKCTSLRMTHAKKLCYSSPPRNTDRNANAMQSVVRAGTRRCCDGSKGGCRMSGTLGRQGGLGHGEGGQGVGRPGFQCCTAEWK
ncbi:hypothetical protein L538_2674 [Bordetella hinzii 4161]|nr:hypothetical protein L538_2674 [Bordetella hinzii 4161]